MGESLITAAFQVNLETANQASTASGAVATPEQKVDNTKHMPPPPDGENYTSDEDCIEGMFNHNGQCPECGGGGARYTLCQDCEDSGMIYEISHGLTPMETMNQNQGTQLVIARKHQPQAAPWPPRNRRWTTPNICHHPRMVKTTLLMKNA